jgi:hypothetical protein
MVATPSLNEDAQETLQGILLSISIAYRSRKEEIWRSLAPQSILYYNCKKKIDVGEVNLSLLLLYQHSNHILNDSNMTLNLYKEITRS